MKTIKQIADDLGVSKQAVQKRISREPLYTSLSLYIHTSNNTKYIDETGENLIKKAFDKTASTTARIDVSDNQPTTTDNQVTTLIDMLKHELEVKNQQIAELQQSNHELTAALQQTTSSLQAAHALHAGTIQSQKQLTGIALDYTEEQPTAAEDTDKPGFFDRLLQIFK